MATLDPIIDDLKKKIASLNLTPEMTHTGTVISSGDGIARIYGL